MGRLSGKSVIVTGASRGIGAATAEAMVAEGAAVLLLARSAEGITALATRLRKAGAQAEAMTCDVAEYSQVQAAVARAHEAFGRIDALINNAGVIEPIGPLAAVDARAWTHAIDINFKGIFHGIRAVLPGMRAQGSGIIVNVELRRRAQPARGLEPLLRRQGRRRHADPLRRTSRTAAAASGSSRFSPGTVATDMQRKIKASGINPVSQMDFASHAPVEEPARALVWL